MVVAKIGGLPYLRVKKAANFSGYKAGHGVLHVNNRYLSSNQPKIPSLKKVGGGVDGDLQYTDPKRLTTKWPSSN